MCPKCEKLAVATVIHSGKPITATGVFQGFPEHASEKDILGKPPPPRVWNTLAVVCEQESVKNPGDKSDRHSIGCRRQVTCCCWLLTRLQWWHVSPPSHSRHKFTPHSLSNKSPGRREEWASRICLALLGIIGLLSFVAWHIGPAGVHSGNIWFHAESGANDRWGSWSDNISAIYLLWRWRRRQWWS